MYESHVGRMIKTSNISWEYFSLFCFGRFFMLHIIPIDLLAALTLKVA